MHAPRPDRTTLRGIIKRTVTVATLVTIVGAGAAGGTAHAWTDQRLPDLVATGSTDVVVVDNTGTALLGQVRNDVSGWSAFAQASNATIKYQPVSRLVVAGATHYINTPGTNAITATGPVSSLAPGGEDRFSAHSQRTPWGLNRITVCADSSGLVAERSEVNNCSSEIKDVVPLFVS
jgi:hypothetical protein